MSERQLFWFVRCKEILFAALLRHFPGTVGRKPVCLRIDCENS